MGRVVCAAPGGRQVRLLQVYAGQVSTVAHRGERRGLVADVPGRRGDQDGEHRGGAVPAVEVDRPTGLPWVAGGEGAPTAAVDVQVDEAGHHPGGQKVGPRVV